MDRPENLDLTNRSDIQPTDILSEELRYAVLHARRPGMVFRVHANGGSKSPEDVELLYFPTGGRAGVAWHGTTWWLDAASPDDALQRWVRGDGRSNSERHNANHALWGRETDVPDPGLESGVLPLSVPTPPVP